jgi:FkbM family methyltransferase
MKNIINLLIKINITLVSLILGIFDRIYQKKIIKILKKIFNNKIDIIFDVGAHRGEFTNLMLRNFVINKIHLFEPNPENFYFIKNKFKQEKIILDNYALGEKKEEKKFKIMRETSSSTFSEINKNTKYFKRKNLILNLGMNSEIFKEISIKIINGAKLIEREKINSIDLLKIDTEGHEYYVIKGFEGDISKIKVIFFEHHYDQMIIKNYKFSDIHNYLRGKNFKQHSKFKMPFRKSFEYIYVNNNYL